MSRSICAALALAFAFAPAAAVAAPQQRQAAQFGLGLGGSWWGGGVAGRYNLSDSQFVQGSIGTVGTPDARGPGLTFDYMLRTKELKNNGDVALSAYFGGGASLGGSDDDGPILGLLPGAGLQVDVLELPIDINIEYRPLVAVLPDPNIGLIGLGVRVHYWF